MFLESAYENQPILVISDYLRISERAESKVLSGERRDLFVNAFLRAGISESQLFFVSEPSKDLEALKSLILNPNIKLIIPLGEAALQLSTGLKSISKWHCSVLPMKAEYGGKQCMPLFHPEYIQKVYRDIFYIAFGGIRAKEILDGKFKIPERKFHLVQDYETAIKILTEKVLRAKELAIDIETGRGQINTMGFAWSETEAVAIRMSPELYTPEQHLRLWQLIGRILESSIPKTASNAIYEILYLARYGIHVTNIVHDTQYCMKYLHPEADKGLDNVARIYTPYPYWKDDNDDWGNVQDWLRHLKYNCFDTIGSFCGWKRQKEALERRKIDKLFYEYQMKMLNFCREMCINGMDVDEEKLENLRIQIMKKAEHLFEFIQRYCKSAIGREINPKSPAQVKSALKEMGIKLPTKKDKKSGEEKEASDKKALMKLARKYPDNPVLPELMELSKVNKQLSSYVNFKYDNLTKKVHYTFDGHANETSRMACYLDPWGRGFNAQTLPSFIKGIFIPPPGQIMGEIDLAQAESRYVAWDCNEKTLMRMLESDEDVHSFVAGRIFNKSAKLCGKGTQERQLGKKSGHAANYGVGPRTFAEDCATERIYISDYEARRIIDGYFQVFPGIRQRQIDIQKELRRTKILKTPIGRERVFYDRIGDNLFREAYAYAPQSTIPDITNTLALYLKQCFEDDINFIAQIHDALLFSCPIGREAEIAEAARDYKAWHPKIILKGGELIIPVTVEAGFNRKDMKAI